MILNLGAGQRRMNGALNVDVTLYPGVDRVVDLNILSWPWKDNSIDKIYMIHSLEHFKDTKSILNECHRILKKGGILHLEVPHPSNIAAQGCLGHYRTFSYNTFNDYLGRKFYLMGDRYFRTVRQEMYWFSPGKVDGSFAIPIIILRPLINWLIKLSPALFENLWCYWVGGARNVLWEGVKE